MNSPVVFDAYSRYYEILYQDKDYSGEVDHIKTLLTQEGIFKGDLLDFGSGTGTHGRLLADCGYRVHGIERSAEMVAQAIATDGFSCQQGDICTVQLGRTFEAVLSLFHVVSYQTRNVDLMSVFARAADHLRTGGLFIFDFWYSPAVYAQRPTTRVKRMTSGQVEIIRIAEPVIYPNENRVDVNYTIIARDNLSGVVRTITETHPMRHFSLPEIDFLAAAQGFERIGALEFLTNKPPSVDTWGVCVSLRKI